MALVVHGRRIGRNGHQVRPFPVAESRLFVQFPLGGLQRRFPFFAHPGAYLITGPPQTVAVLPLHDKFSIFGQGYHIDPIRILQHVIFIVFHAVWKSHPVTPRRQPRAADEIFAFQNSPLLVFVVRHIKLFTTQR